MATMNINVGLGRGQADGYTVQHIENCKIIWGRISIDDFAALATTMGENALMDAGLANRIGATFVCGLSADLERLKKHEDLPVSEDRLHDARQAVSMGMPAAVVSWLKYGERGASSNALCMAIYGVPAEVGNSHPNDPDDFSRCHRFLEETGSRTQLERMKVTSSVWRALVERWDEVEALFLEERHTGSWPRTYVLMREIIDAEDRKL